MFDVMVVGYYLEQVIFIDKDCFIGMEIVLVQEIELEEFVVEYCCNFKLVNCLNFLLVEEFGVGEFKKVVCCNLLEFFEINVMVDVSLSDVVLGVKKIQLFGLDGVYMCFQMENVLFLIGLEGVFGVNVVFGMWVEFIQIMKGIGMVVNGYELMLGLINVQFQQLCMMLCFFVNGYGNILGRSEFNLYGG